jgi:20S proteasome subunit beta 7
MHGSNYTDDTVATGYGAHIARPLLRKYYKPDLSKEEAIKLVEMCMTVLYYRDKATINKIQFSVASAEGVVVLLPRELSTEWTNMEKPSNMATQKIVRIT